MLQIFKANLYHILIMLHLFPGCELVVPLLGSKVSLEHISGFSYSGTVSFVDQYSETISIRKAKLTRTSNGKIHEYPVYFLKQCDLLIELRHISNISTISDDSDERDTSEEEYAESFVDENIQRTYTDSDRERNENFGGYENEYSNSEGILVEVDPIHTNYSSNGDSPSTEDDERSSPYEEDESPDSHTSENGSDFADEYSRTVHGPINSEVTDQEALELDGIIIRILNDWI